MKELSIFIDESGDFGEAKELPAHYLVTFVFHNQDNSISEQVHKLENSVRASGYDFEYIHTGPVIRREDIFKNYTIDDRRKLIFKMLNFVVSTPIQYFTVAVDRKEARNKVQLSGKLAKAIQNELYKHESFLCSYDKFIVYYDNGQQELSAILSAVLSITLQNVEFRSAEPQKYRLLQATDFICSIELLRIKNAENRLSNSEKKFFYKSQELKKTFFKSVDKKRL